MSELKWPCLLQPSQRLARRAEEPAWTDWSWSRLGLCPENTAQTQPRQPGCSTATAPSVPPAPASLLLLFLRWEVSHTRSYHPWYEFDPRVRWWCQTDVLTYLIKTQKSGMLKHWAVTAGQCSCLASRGAGKAGHCTEQPC